MPHVAYHPNVVWDLAPLVTELTRIRGEMLALEAEYAERAVGRDPASLPSLRNFLHYLALRRTDLRPTQELLERRGLSSLGRAEAHTLASVDAVLEVVARLRGVTFEGRRSAGAPSFEDGQVRLIENARALFGPESALRAVRIMVTLPGEAARDRALVRSLIDNGTDLVRINCAHDDEETWRAMITNVRECAEEARRPCLVEMELGGPKLRISSGVETSVQLGDAVHLARGPDASIDGAPAPLFTLSEPEVLDRVRLGERIFFDDGKVSGVIEQVRPEGVVVRLTQVRTGGHKLRVDRGINLPDSTLNLPALRPKDRQDLRFVAAHADVIGMSFVQGESDVVDLDAALTELGVPRSRGMILKIETKLGFQGLPRILLAATGLRPVGVMIARGDLAIECGYERLAEVQEEILWLCEAAHVPVIWATQVLERLAKDGLPTRAEITDAAMSERAECVMLNKGKHVVDAVVLLDDILRRMHAHQHKKSARLRPLSVSRF